jgi:hypothetical protein
LSLYTSRCTPTTDTEGHDVSLLRNSDVRDLIRLKKIRGIPMWLDRDWTVSRQPLHRQPCRLRRSRTFTYSGWIRLKAGRDPAWGVLLQHNCSLACMIAFGTMDSLFMYFHINPKVKVLAALRAYEATNVFPDSMFPEHA